VQPRAVHVLACVYKHTTNKNPDYSKDAVVPMPNYPHLLFLSSHCGLLTISQPVLYHPEHFEFVFVMLKTFSQPDAEKVRKHWPPSNYMSSVRSAIAEPCLTG